MILMFNEFFSKSLIFNLLLSEKITHDLSYNIPIELSTYAYLSRYTNTKKDARSWKIEWRNPFQPTRIDS